LSENDVYKELFATFVGNEDSEPKLWDSMGYPASKLICVMVKRLDLL
jgi:hypothetical protein